jgi:hypothetical protein
MPTIINNPSQTPPEPSSTGMGFMFGLILLILFFFLFFYYGLPALRGSTTPTVNIPEQIDVNINPGNQQPAPPAQ